MDVTKPHKFVGFGALSQERAKNGHKTALALAYGAEDAGKTPPGKAQSRVFGQRAFEFWFGRLFFGAGRESTQMTG